MIQIFQKCFKREITPRLPCCREQNKFGKANLANCLYLVTQGYQHLVTDTDSLKRLLTIIVIMK
jgi:hypothetical protein